MSHVTKVLVTKSTDIFKKKKKSKIPEQSLTKVNPLEKHPFTGKNSNLQLARKLAHFVEDHEPSSVKGFNIPFLKVLVQSTTPYRWLFKKTIEMLHEGATEKKTGAVVHI